MSNNRGPNRPGVLVTLLDAVTSITHTNGDGIGPVVRVGDVGNVTIHGKVRGTGAVTATVNIYGSLFDEAGNILKAVLLGTLTLSGTTDASDSINIDAYWPFIFADITAISGTGAICDVRAAY